MQIIPDPSIDLLQQTLNQYITIMRYEADIPVLASAIETSPRFHELLDETYVAYLEGKLVGYEKRGRPAKGNVEFHAQIKPDVKKNIAAKARALGISQGEVIAYFNAFGRSKKGFGVSLQCIEGKNESLNLNS